MSEKIYPKGIRCFKPRDGAPQAILGTMVISVDEFKDWIESEASEYYSDYQGKAQLKLTVWQSDKTGVNLNVDTYRKPNQ